VFFLGEGGAGAKRKLTVLTEITTVFIKPKAVKIILLVSSKFLVSAQVARKPFFLSLSSFVLAARYPVVYFLTLSLFLEIIPVCEKNENEIDFSPITLYQGKHVSCHTDEALTKSVILLILIVLGEDYRVYKEVFSLPIISLESFQEFTSKIQEEKNIKRRSSKQHASR